MKGLKEYTIPFVGLKEGTHKFQYQINNTFFEEFQYAEFNKTDIQVDIDFIKKSTLLELLFTIKGTVTIPCDVTNELYDQEISGDFKLIVKFGPEFNDENDEILVLPYEEYQVNVAQYIYELVVLSIPTKRVHPDVLNGTMESETLKKLKELEINKEKPVEEESTDPRWDKLKDLLTGKNE
ncbi:YceD family protein [Tenacibaculum amylolyticum]|uniref:YceD family protein n=1 Tax=Tenacibaculum amylolyticum TaxID=104269 RepID=UPI0038935E23